jgi:DNA-directed RNA polymerase specialized sigma subunit
MAESIISLSPSMKRRLDFDHPLLDHIPEGEAGRLNDNYIELLLAEYTKTRGQAERDELIMGFLWLVKDMVCRFRAHWKETQRMTDDLVSVGVEALTEFVNNYEEPTTALKFFGGCQQFLHSRMRGYINDNRSTFSASKTTNQRRQKKDEPLEYNYAAELNEELAGMDVNDPLLVDIMDSIEAMNDIDAEEMRDLVLQFLDQQHNISEEELSDEERATIEKVTQLVRNAGL